MLQRKQNGTFVNYFQIFLLVRNVFVCFKLLRNHKISVLYFKKWYQNETKTLQIAPGFSKDKTKRIDYLKKFWKQNKTKAFGQKNFWTDRKGFVSIQNFDLKTFTFDLFGNESSKTEASDLERSLIWHCYSKKHRRLYTKSYGSNGTPLDHPPFLAGQYLYASSGGVK